MTNQTLAAIIGNRDFFPDRLVSEGRREILAVLAEMGVKPVILDEADTKLGAVETWDDAKKCAELFKEHRDEIDGILVVLPNFGDEKGIADTIKLSGLNVPILVQAYPDDLDQLQRRAPPRCLLRQDFGLQQPAPVRLSLHADRRAYRSPHRETLQGRSAPVPRRVPGGEGLRSARLGAIGARPGCVQHRALQREAAAGRRHQRDHGRPLRDHRRGRQLGR